MPTNYNQLLKDLEIGSVYIKIFICFMGCTFMLYPVLFYFTHFFRELSVYEQIFFALGSSALYTGLGVPLSITSAIRYPGVFYLPLMLLSVSVIATIYIVFFMARSYDPLTTLLWILPTSYLLNLITGVISILREKKYPKTEMYY